MVKPLKLAVLAVVVVATQLLTVGLQPAIKEIPVEALGRLFTSAVAAVAVLVLPVLPEPELTVALVAVVQQTLLLVHPLPAQVVVAAVLTPAHLEVLALGDQVAAVLVQRVMQPQLLVLQILAVVVVAVVTTAARPRLGPVLLVVPALWLSATRSDNHPERNK